MSEIKLGWYKVFDELEPFKVVHIREDKTFYPVLGHFYDGSSNEYPILEFKQSSTWIGKELEKWVPFDISTLLLGDLPCKARFLNNNNVWVTRELMRVSYQRDGVFFQDTHANWYSTCEIWKDWES